MVLPFFICFKGLSSKDNFLNLLFELIPLRIPAIANQIIKCEFAQGWSWGFNLRILRRVPKQKNRFAKFLS